MDFRKLDEIILRLILSIHQFQVINTMSALPYLPASTSWTYNSSNLDDFYAMNILVRNHFLMGAC